MKLDLQGIVPAAFTPMHQNGDLNLDVIDQYVDLLEKENISNVFILGTAGEGCSLSVEERKKVAEKWMKSAKNRIKNVIVHVGSQSLVDTKTLSEHAESIGASGIATVSSFYFKPKSVKHLSLYLAEVAKAAPNTPTLYYHMPNFTGVNFKVKEIFDEIEKIGVPNFAGVKYTGPDLCDFGRCIDCYGHKYSICYGVDEQLSAGLLMGAQSGVGSTYNYALKLYQNLYHACKQEDLKLVRELQFKAQRFISYLLSEDLDIGMGKALMIPSTGIDVGPPRLPMLPTPKKEMDKLVGELTKMGFFEWLK
ncbi:N-acetylneuraminate lyase-like [Styela clava]